MRDQTEPQQQPGQVNPEPDGGPAIHPGDLIFMRDPCGNHHLYEVDSVVLGSLHTESVVGLVSLTHNAGRNDSGEKLLVLYVPECLIRIAPIYTRIR